MSRTPEGNEPGLVIGDLVLSLVGASAVLNDKGLVLTAQGQEHFLAREEPSGGGVGAALQSGEPGTGPGGRSGG